MSQNKTPPCMRRNKAPNEREEPSGRFTDFDPDKVFAVLVAFSAGSVVTVFVGAVVAWWLT